jgi:N-acetylmuramoyl-L-alanine amidase
MKRLMMRSAAVSGLVLAALFFSAASAEAAPAYFYGEPLAHESIESDGHDFIALDDITLPLGLSVIFDGENYLVGGTIHGTIRIDPDATSLSADRNLIDYEVPVMRSEGLLFIPDRLLDGALGVKTVKRSGTGEVDLYAEVVAITPGDGGVRISSSIPPIFQTFELDSPSRRVIDISGSFLRGQTLSVAGNTLGLSGLAALRASQFALEPPVVRIVFEWDTETPPSHTLFPESRTLAVLINSSAGGSSSTGGGNLLTGNDEGTSDTETQNEGQPVEPGNETETPTGGQENPVIPDPIVPQPPIGLGPEVPFTQPPQIEPIDIPQQTPEDFPEGAENLSLGELGWNFSLELNADGELTTTIDTPPFQNIDEFTLAREGGMRLVIDVEGTYLPGDERRVEGLLDIGQIRIAQFQPTITRIVFDLNRVLAYQLEYDQVAGLITVKLLEGDLTGKTIAVDPGHGGCDPGAVVDGIREADLNLAMSLELKSYLEGQGAKVLLTRENDVYVSLADRMAVAVNSNSDLFVCIHNNATEEPTAIQGALIIYNDSDMLRLYRLVHRGIAARTAVVGLGPVPDERGLYLLRHNGTIPVLFVEAAFMTNTIDLARLTDSSGAYGKNIMMGVMDGILAYYANRDLPPVQLPEYSPGDLEGVFDLAGKPIVFADTGDSDESEGAEDSDDDSGAPSEVSGDDGSDDDSDSGSGDDDEEYHRRRGRGAYRYR